MATYNTISLEMQVMTIRIFRMVWYGLLAIIKTSQTGDIMNTNPAVNTDVQNDHQ